MGTHWGERAEVRTCLQCVSMSDNNGFSSAVIAAHGNRRRTFRWLCRIFLRKSDLELEEPAFPDSLLLAWNATIPLLEVHHAVRAAHGFREEAKRMVASPLLPWCCISATHVVPYQSRLTSPQRGDSYTETLCSRGASVQPLRCRR